MYLSMKKVFSLFSLALLAVSAWGANTYVKADGVDQLEAGKNYILVNEEAGVALGAITGTSTKYGSAVSITLENGVIDIEGTDVVELVAGQSGTTQNGQTWTFSMNGESSYLIWTSGNSLNTVNAASEAAGSMWIPALTDDGVILKNNGDITRILQYNSSAPRFACYTSAQKPAVLYVQATPEDGGIASLSEANALEDGADFTFKGDAVVTLFKNGYLFVRDESGYGQIRGITEGEFVNGQVLSQGWTATKASNGNGWAWYTDAAGLAASGENNAELAAAQKLTGAVDESLLNAYVYIENVTISGGFFPGMPMRSLPLPDGTSIAVTSTLWSTNWPAGGNKNVYGIICKVGDAYQFNVVNFEDYVAPPAYLRGDVNNNGVVDIDDVTLLIDVVLGKDVTYLAAAADCNTETGDGSVDIDDVTALIDRVLNGVW